MCGIVGCISETNSGIQCVSNGLVKLQNRGYDSAGIGYLDEDVITICKKISTDNNNAIESLVEKTKDNRSTICIGHTRWATHGPKTKENAHPHQTADGKVTLVHNGIIENYLELKKELCEYGYDFIGQTDSEVIANYYHLLTTLNVSETVALTQLASILKGSWALLIIINNSVHFLRNGSPLLVGWNEDSSTIMFASEFAGFENNITHYSVLPNNSYGIVSDMCVHCLSHKLILQNMNRVDYEISPDPFKHWTLKEIHDQPMAVRTLLKERVKRGKPYFPEFNRNKISKIKYFIFIACGTSYFAAQVGASMFRKAGIVANISVINGADFEKYHIVNPKNTMFIVLSQSGETKDLCRGLEIAKENRVMTVGLVNVENSLIAREVDVVIYLKSGREHAVASTKSFMNQIVTLHLLGNWIAKNTLPNLHALPDMISKTIRKSENFIKSISKLFDGQEHCFLLGKHTDEWIAKEGSLKIKEISYIHAEGYASAALKHGPFALLSENTPVIILAPNDSNFSKSMNVCSEVSSRHATTICITNSKDKINVNRCFQIKCSNDIFSFLAVIPLQMLAYKLSLIRGINPDYPRNLAKVVTVD